MRNRRVLFLCAQPLFEARGSPIRILATLTALGRNDWNVTVLTLPVGPDAGLPPTVRVRRVPNLLRVRSISIGPSASKFFFGLLIGLQALVQAIRERPTVIHGVEEMGLMAWLVGRLTGASIVYEKHSDPASYAGGGPLKRLIMAAYRRVEIFVSRRADAVIATGPGLAGQVIAFRPRGQVVCIPDVPSSERDPDPGGVAEWRRRFDPEGERLVALYVGSFADYQGVPLLVESLPEAFERVPELCFVLVGGGDAPELLAKIRGFGLSADRLVHVPFVDPSALPDLLAAADILVSPRILGNNTPLKVLDYMKAARAILATDTEANRLVLDGNVARLVDPDAASLASGLVGLCEDGKQRESLGLAARLRFDAEFGHARFAAALNALYSSLEKGRRWACD